MPSIISNIAAMSAQGNISAASSRASASIARLSSGSRIAKASDDVAGLSTGTALRTQVTTLKQALANASQGTSLLQVADGGLSQIVDILQRQKAIATQASSGQLTDANRSLLNQEFSNLAAEIDRIAGSTNFNGVKLINGGLGTVASLANTDALAVTAGVTTTAAASGQTAAQGTTTVSVKAIEAWDTATGLNRRGFAAAGNLDVTDSGGTILTDAAYLNVSSALYGQFSSFKISNVTYGATGTATITATINGVDFTGNVTSGATSALLNNGNTYIKLGTSAITLTNAGTVALAQANLAKDFATTAIGRAQVLTGTDFSGTSLAGTTGIAGAGAIAVRTYSSDVSISNFRYVGNASAANTSILSVDVNGQTFTATTVEDAQAAANKIIFTSSDSQVLYLDLTGLTTGVTNIRTDVQERTRFINALNTAVSRAGGGLNFSVGSSSTDQIKVALSSASTLSLYGGSSLDVTSASSATTAAAALDGAITKAVSLRASVGALQSRFNFASDAVQSALQNQDAARGSLLDTDVSTESTAFSSAQVQLQAGISVLAQANQMPQNLLKLIQ